MSDKNRVDNKPDELDGFLDPNPGKRLVWMIPSILLHVVIFALWLLMPEKERVVEKRKVVINKQQAEQLQKFVEDANLVELRMQVTRLQDIKKQMDAIRLQEISTLKNFAKDMQTDLDADVFLTLNSIKDLQGKILIDQKKALQSINLIYDDCILMTNAVEASHYTNMSIIATRILDENQSVKDTQSQLLQNLQLLQANIDSADSTLSWISVQTIQKKWGDLVDLQEDVLVKQVESLDKEPVISGSQVNAFKTLKTDGLKYEKALSWFNEVETNKIVRYWNDFNYSTSSTNSAAKDLAQSEVRRQEMDAKRVEIEKAMEIQDTILKGVSSTPEEKEKSQIAKKEYDRLKAQRDKCLREIKVIDGIIARNRSTIRSSEERLSKLTYPTAGYLPYNVRIVNTAVANIGVFPEPIGLQKDAIQEQEKAINLLDELFGKVKIHMETNQ